MAQLINSQIVVEPAQFTSLGAGGVAIGDLITQIQALALSAQPDVIFAIAANRVLFQWATTVPTTADITAINNACAAHLGRATSFDPTQFSNLSTVSATTATFVSIFDVTTTPLAAGAYLLTVASEINMLAAVAGTAARAQLLLGAGAGTRIAQTSNPLVDPVAFTLGAQFGVVEGGQMRIRLQISKTGASAATAQAANSRMTLSRF